MRLSALAVAIATVVTSPSLAGQQPPTLLDQDAYAVYGSALRLPGIEVPSLALLAHTRADASCEDRIPAGWEDVAADFRQANSQQHTLLEGFDLGRPYQLVAASDLAAAEAASRDYVEHQLGDLDPPAPWPFRSFPGAKVFILSAVGFNPTRTRAMFMLQHTSGFSGHGGEQVLRVKVAGQWIDPSDVPLRCAWFT
jgi:hypothetical protein